MIDNEQFLARIEEAADGDGNLDWETELWNA